YEAQEVLGKDVTELMPDYHEHIHKPEAKLGTTERHYDWKGVEMRGLHKDGHEVPLEVSFNEFSRAGQKLRTGIIRDINERKRAEEVLRLNRRVLEASAFPILIADAQAPDMPLLYVNPAFERTTGYSAAEVLGQNCRFLQGADRDQPGLAELREAMREGRDCTVLLRNYRKDGSLFWNELTVSPVRDAAGQITHFVGFENDVTEKKQAEQAVLEATAIQRAIVDYTSYAILATTPTGVITTFNPAAERMLGYSAEEMIGEQTPALLLDPGEITERARQFAKELGQPLVPGFEVLVAKSRLNQPNEYEWTYRRKDGSSLPVLLSVTALRDAKDEITGFLCVAGDLTERKRAQERFARQTALRLAISNALTEADASLKQVLQRGAEAVVEHLHTSMVRIWLLDGEGVQLQLQASAGLVKTTPESAIPVGEGRIGKIALERKPRLSKQAGGDAVLFKPGSSDAILIELEAPNQANVEKDWAAHEGLESFAGYPLLSGDRLLGVLAVY